MTDTVAPTTTTQSPEEEPAGASDAVGDRDRQAASPEAQLRKARL